MSRSSSTSPTTPTTTTAGAGGGLVLRDSNASSGSLGKTGSGLGQRVWVEQDRNGDVVGLIDDTGHTIEHYRYDPYGTVHVFDGSWDALSGGSAYGWRYLFEGQRFDATTGLYDFRHRAYDPTLGRFLQQDPMGYVDGANLYQMERSNPLAFADPMGTDSASGGGSISIQVGPPPSPISIKIGPPPGQGPISCPANNQPPARPHQFPPNWVPGKGVPYGGTDHHFGIHYGLGPDLGLYPLPGWHQSNDGQWLLPPLGAPPTKPYSPGPKPPWPERSRICIAGSVGLITGGAGAILLGGAAGAGAAGAWATGIIGVGAAGQQAAGDFLY